MKKIKAKEGAIVKRQCNESQRRQELAHVRRRVARLSCCGYGLIGERRHGCGTRWHSSSKSADGIVPLRRALLTPLSRGPQFTGRDFFILSLSLSLSTSLALLSPFFLLRRNPNKSCIVNITIMSRRNILAIVRARNVWYNSSHCSEAAPYKFQRLKSAINYAGVDSCRRMYRLCN